MSPARSRPAPSVPLRPDQAAARLLAFMQANDYTGQRYWSGPYGIWNFYLWHCDEEELQPIPDQLLANALAKVCTRCQVRDRSTGEMRRLMTYVITQRVEPPIAVAKGKRRQPPGRPPKLQERPLARAA